MTAAHAQPPHCIRCRSVFVLNTANAHVHAGGAVAAHHQQQQRIRLQAHQVHVGCCSRSRRAGACSAGQWPRKRGTGRLLWQVHLSPCIPHSSRLTPDLGLIQQAARVGLHLHRAMCSWGSLGRILCLRAGAAAGFRLCGFSRLLDPGPAWDTEEDRLCSRLSCWLLGDLWHELLLWIWLWLWLRLVHRLQAGWRRSIAQYLRSAMAGTCPQTAVQRVWREGPICVVMQQLRVPALQVSLPLHGLTAGQAQPIQQHAGLLCLTCKHTRIG